MGLIRSPENGRNTIRKWDLVLILPGIGKTDIVWELGTVSFIPRCIRFIIGITFPELYFAVLYYWEKSLWF